MRERLITPRRTKCLLARVMATGINNYPCARRRMTSASLPFIRRFSFKKPTSRCKPTGVYFWSRVRLDAVRTHDVADLVVAPYETDNHGLFFPSLHTIHRTDLKL